VLFVESARGPPKTPAVSPPPPPAARSGAAFRAQLRHLHPGQALPLRLIARSRRVIAELPDLEGAAEQAARAENKASFGADLGAGIQGLSAGFKIASRWPCYDR
jgi:hypothetical protein